MAVTSLIIVDTKTKERKYVRIVTQPDPPKGLVVIIEQMDPEFTFKQGADIGTDNRNSEWDYHRELRTMAAEKEQLITSHSTNPEWNPEGYKKNLYDVIHAYKCNSCNEDWIASSNTTVCVECLSSDITRRKA